MSEHDDTVRAAVRRGRGVAATLLLGVLTALPVAAGCGDAATVSASASPSARTAPTDVPATGDTGPPKFSGGVCERTTADRKSLPSLARITVERFVSAVDKGHREAMRSLLDPAGAGEVLADLRPVTRLGLLALEDRY
jgi:hypothetical protein